MAERTAQLEASNEELEAFSYSVSHDLRAPLRAIGGFARILSEEHAAKLEPEAADYLRDISKNAVEMGQLIDDLLQLSHVGRQGLALEAADPADVARRALDKLKPEMEGRAIEVEVANLPGCNADPALLQQVYLNLLGNAIKFTRACTVARIDVGSIEGEGPVVYFVKDNGAGFDMAYVDKLFAVFQRLHRQEEYEGTGVGLAIVQRIVTRHGGRIWAEGEPGVGASFYFTLAGGGAG
ncbi:MAG TPA: ATP-binding protein [Candidatus Dormibacteraeota bacterium]